MSHVLVEPGLPQFQGLLQTRLTTPPEPGLGLGKKPHATGSLSAPWRGRDPWEGAKTRAGLGSGDRFHSNPEARFTTDRAEQGLGPPGAQQVPQR